MNGSGDPAGNILFQQTSFELYNIELKCSRARLPETPAATGASLTEGDNDSVRGCCHKATLCHNI